MKLLLVRWRDATSKHLGWVSEDELSKGGPPVAVTVGFEYERKDGFLKLISSYVDEDGQRDYSLDTIILEGMILEERELS